MIRFLKTVFFAAVGFVAARRLGRRPSTRDIPPPEDATDASRRELSTFLKRLGMLVAALAVVGMLVVVTGIVPFKASSGHWGITAWFLNFTMDRSVVLHSTGIKAPDLDDPVLVLKGAGHYDFGCRPCHGDPQHEYPKITQRMTPPPPHLPTLLDKWEPEELFYIVKHGMKFTGMPAWPAQTRDDEVWAVVAFLRELPGLDVATYTALVRGPDIATVRRETDARDSASATDERPTGAPMAEDPLNPSDTTAEDSPDASDVAEPLADAPIEALVSAQDLEDERGVPGAVHDRCGICHGVRGEGREVGAFPRLAAQRPQYLFASLTAYADGDRHSGIMQPIAAALTEEEMREVAFYYARMRSAEVPPADVDSAAAERGRRIAHEGIPNRRVPSCADCHGPGSLPRNPFYPDLAGQFAEYIELQLQLFKDDRRGGSVYARLMHPTADDLTEQQMHDVAQYYASVVAGSSAPEEEAGTESR